MKKYLFLFLFIFATTSYLSFAQVTVSIYSPLRFKDVNSQSLLNDYIVGEGTIQISSDNEEEDIGKLLLFNFPEAGIMTNKKRGLKIYKYEIENNNKEFEIKNSNQLVKFYGYVKRRDINNNGIADDTIDGEYVGCLPVIISQYSKKQEPTK